MEKVVQAVRGHYSQLVQARISCGSRVGLWNVRDVSSAYSVLTVVSSCYFRPHFQQARRGPGEVKVVRRRW